MKTAFLTKTGFEIREEDIPPCGDNKILVKTIACGVCEGDVFQYKMRENLTEPVKLGHEGTGVVSKVGKSVTEFQPGDVVTSNWGAYSEYFVVSPGDAARLPENVSPVYALGEPVACFVHASHRFGIVPGDRVAVIGCGYMGMGCVQMSRVLGAGEICAMEPIAWRRENALKHGATAQYDPTGKTPEDILADFGEFDVVIEATGAEAVIDICTLLVKQHGKIILVGYHQSNQGRRNVDMKTWNFKAIDVINGHVRRDDEKCQAMQEGMRLLAEGKLNFDGMIETYPLEEVEKAFADLLARKENLYKAVLVLEPNP